MQVSQWQILIYRDSYLSQKNAYKYHNVFDSETDAVFMSFTGMSDATVNESNLISLATSPGVVGVIKKLFDNGGGK